MFVEDLEATITPAKTPRANEIRPEGEKELSTICEPEKSEQTHKMGRATKELAANIMGKQLK